jgi:hypothetical protein
MITDPDVIAQIRQTLGIFFQPGDVTELRVLNVPGAGVVSGFYNDLDCLARDAARWDGKAPGVYVVLNPVKPELLGRSPNHFKTHCGHGDLTKDADILKRRWLPVDFDPARPSDTSSTDTEHCAALARARVVRSSLAVAENWPEAIVADSGNGAHLLYRVDFPNDEGSRERIRAALVMIKERFSTAAVKVDTSVSNAARIWKVYGTMACKGINTLERPHRRSCILELPLENP